VITLYLGNASSSVVNSSTNWEKSFPVTVMLEVGAMPKGTALELQSYTLAVSPLGSGSLGVIITSEPVTSQVLNFVEECFSLPLKMLH